MDIAQNNNKIDNDKIISLLVDHDIKPTRQRVTLASLLFDDNKHKHVTAEHVLGMVKESNVRVSLATVYNTLNHFTKAGLLKEIFVDQYSNYFDTDVSTHYHFFDEVTGKICDIPPDAISTECLPKPPDGREIGRVDVTIRLQEKK